MVNSSHASMVGDLRSCEADELDVRGFVVLPGPLAPDEVPALAAAYDAEMATAVEADRKVGRTSTRVMDFVNRGPVFDSIYVHRPLLQAALQVIGPDFRLSSFQARTLHAGARDQGLHVDVARGAAAWPLLGFILMIDAFRADNGATRFIPGSHRWPLEPPEPPVDRSDVEAATGPAGALLVFNGSTWHGHGTNRSAAPRRSLQGAFIPRSGPAATDFLARMTSSTRERIGPAALSVLGG